MIVLSYIFGFIGLMCFGMATMLLFSKYDTKVLCMGFVMVGVICAFIIRYCLLYTL